MAICPRPRQSKKPGTLLSSMTELRAASSQILAGQGSNDESVQAKWFQPKCLCPHFRITAVRGLQPYLFSAHLYFV